MSIQEQLRERIDENFKLRAEIERLRAETNAMAHVIVEHGIMPDDLRRCGCDECRRVFDGMKEVGYISGEWSDVEAADA